MTELPSALDRLQVQLRDVDNLIEHHSSGGLVGRPATDEGPLNRSCVVLTYAAWEVFVEDSLVAAVERLAALPNFRSLPAETQSFLATEAVSDPGLLADDGWRQFLVDAAKRLTRGDVDAGDFGLNTASPAQIAKLHDRVLGIRLLDGCRWHRRSTPQVKAEIARLVRERGSIVHRGTPDKQLHLRQVRAYRDFIGRLSITLDARTTEWVAGVEAAASA